MTTLQDHYTAITRQGQEATLAVIDAWTRSFQDAAARLPKVAGQAATHQVIDQVFDFAVTVVDVQRNFAKQLVTSTVSVAEDAAQQVSTAANKAATEAANAVTSTGRAKKPAE